MDIYSLKRRWGKSVVIYSITGSTLDLETGQKVVTRVSQRVNKAVFLPPKQVWDSIKSQAAFDPRASKVLIDKCEVNDFPIKLDDHIDYRNLRFVITEINDHDTFYDLRVHSVDRVIEPVAVEDALVLTQESDHE